jgi:hypothetical protein
VWGCRGNAGVNHVGLWLLLWVKWETLGMFWAERFDLTLIFTVTLLLHGDRLQWTREKTTVMTQVQDDRGKVRNGQTLGMWRWSSQQNSLSSPGGMWEKHQSARNWAWTTRRSALPLRWWKYGKRR